MPSLNEDILLDILNRIDSYRDNNKAECLAKFMLAGKETLAVTLKQFSKAINLEFEVNYFNVSANKWSFSYIPYDFALLEPLMKAMDNNIVDICVQETPSTVKGLQILERFITKKLERFDMANMLPSKPLALLQECKLKTLWVFSWSSHPYHEFFLYDFFMVPSDVHKLRTHFCTIMQSFSSSWIFDQVKSLDIEDCNCGYTDDRMTVPEIQKFYQLLITSFPNLEKIDATFLHYSDSLADRINLDKLIDPALFKKIPSRVKGTIAFRTGSIPMETILGFEGFVVDKEKRYASKKFNAHDELSIEVEFHN